MAQKLYSKNQSVAREVIKRINQWNIKRFRTQNALFCFIEDIRYPHLAARRKYSVHVSSTMPWYIGSQNYGSIISWLVENNYLVKRKTGSSKNSPVTYTVNTEAVKEY